MMKIKRTLVGFLVMVLLVGTSFASVTLAQASTTNAEQIKKITLKVERTAVYNDLKLTWTAVSGLNFKGDVYTGYDDYRVTMTSDKGDWLSYSVKGTTTTFHGLEKDKTYYFEVNAKRNSALYVKDGHNYADTVILGESNRVSYKIPLYQVVDDGEQDVYFYWLWDGKSTVKDSEYNTAWNECMSILEERSADKTGEYPYGSSKTFSTDYCMDGKVVLRSTPQAAKGSETAPKTVEKVKVGTATIKVKNSDIGNNLKLTWKKVSGANGYDVYMSTSENGTYKEVATAVVGTTYTTSGLKKDKTYYFKVKAYTIASIDNQVNSVDKTVTVEVKKTYSSYSKVVSGKTSKYSLNTVIDKGGDNVYHYFLSDGKTAAKDKNYWACHNKCISIIKSRHKGEKNNGYNAGSEELNYYINGKQVVRALPHVLY